MNIMYGAVHIHSDDAWWLSCFRIPLHSLEM